MQRAAGYAVEIRQIAARHRAKPVEIKVSIPHFQWIKSPFDQPNVAAQSFVPLKQFEHASYAAVSVAGNNTSHMRVQVSSTVAQSRQRQRVAYQHLSRVRPEHLSTSLRRHHKRRRWLHFQFRLLPDFALQFHTGLELVERHALSYNNFFAGARIRGSALHFVAAFFAAADCPFARSSSFAWSQSDSISSRGTSANLRPLSRANRSIIRKRDVNLALVRFSAISGSTFRKRARFTAANKTSPISSSICSAACADCAFRNSLSSS